MEGLEGVVLVQFAGHLTGLVQRVEQLEEVPVLHFLDTVVLLFEDQLGGFVCILGFVSYLQLNEFLGEFYSAESDLVDGLDQVQVDFQKKFLEVDVRVQNIKNLGRREFVHF